MATFKAEVYAHQKKQDGTYNIKIRVTQNQKKRYLATPWYVTKEDLTRSMKIKNQRYIDMCDSLIKSYREACDRVGMRLKTMSVDEVVDLVSTEQDKPFDLDILEYGRYIVKKMVEDGHTGNARSYEVALASMERFVGRSQISVKEITVGFLESWCKWIGSQKSVSTGHAQHTYLSKLRAIYNMAKKEFNDEDAGIIRIPNSPFSHFKMPFTPPVRKRAISADSLSKLSELPYMDVTHRGFNRWNLAKDMFLLSFMLIGINEVDLYTCNDCKKGRLTYYRQKTRNRRSDQAEISILIPPEAQGLMEKYKDPSGKRVFCFYHHYSSVDAFCAAINKGLKKIGKALGIDDLEYYAARHTWATIAVNDAGVDKYTVHQCLNHVDDQMKVTDIYIRKSWETIDRANRKVLDFIGFKPLILKENKIYPVKF